MDRLDCIIIGAGVVGLAVGRSLARAGREVVVLEAEPEIGMHSSGRNSEVIHAGLYYPEDSLKARLCVSGKAMLYAYCDEHHVPSNRIGKLVVATNEGDQDRLQQIHAQAQRNGVDDVRMLAAREVRELEPVVECNAALLSPSTGIIDSHTLMLALQGEIEEHGGYVLTSSEVTDVQPGQGEFDLGLAATDDRFTCTTLINAAGLSAGLVADRIAAFPAEHRPIIHYALGHYFAYHGKSPFDHLVYPVPFDGGLGIHATNDLGGGARFGPDVEWVDAIDYTFDESRKARFIESVRRYFPDHEEEKLAPSYTGIRSKLAGPGGGFRDFLIQGERDHGVPALVNLFGIDSPGLTASLAIGDYVTNLLNRA